MNINTKPTVNLDEPRWDQSTYWGRVKHFFITVNPLNLLCSDKELEKAKNIVLRHRNGEAMGLSENELWRAKHIYDSAFHPETGEKVFLVGRMSAQVPVNMFISGAMVNFYKTKLAVMFWQWVNQSSNAIVNYSNRSGDLPETTEQLGISYVIGTGGALLITTMLQHLTTGKYPFISRLVPFVGVATTSCINIPIMRFQELEKGIAVVDSSGHRIGLSRVAAEYGISHVCLSRIACTLPVMVIPPIIMNNLEKRRFPLLLKHPRLRIPIQVSLVGFCLVFATPLCCAIFPQKSPIEVSKLENHIQAKVKTLPHPHPTVLYYNKGL